MGAGDIVLAVRRKAGPEQERELERLCCAHGVDPELVRQYLRQAEASVAARKVRRASGPAGSASAEAGETLGGYVLEQRLGQGGMGVVYRARQVAANRSVAMKMILTGTLASPADRQRFRQEAEMSGLLDHPNIVPIYEVGEHKGRVFYTMKLIDRGSLAARLDQFGDAPAAAALLLATVARAVHHAHQRGILHRDLKPANILFDSKDQPHVVDFGLAKHLGKDGSLTQSGNFVGTPAFVPPEQARGEKALTVAADVYGLGGILYGLLTGNPPFEGNNLFEVLRQVEEQDPRPPRARNPRVPRDLEVICLKCLRKEAERRYASAQELAEDLERWLGDQPIRARSCGIAERLWKWCRRQPGRAAMAVVAAALVLLGPLAVWAYRMHLEGALEEQQLAAHVHALAIAETRQVPQLAESLWATYGDRGGALLEERLKGAVRGSREELHFRVALARKDATQVEYLYQRLLIAGPDEFLVIREALQGHHHELVARLWKVLRDKHTDADQRFRAAWGLASYDVTDNEDSQAAWQNVSMFITNSLLSSVQQNPSHYSPLLEILRPIRASLVDSLTAISRNPNRMEEERSLATSILAEYVADRPHVLINLLLDSDKRFGLLFPRVEAYRTYVMPNFKKRLATVPDSTATEEEKERLAKQQVNAVIALVRLGETEPLWSMLGHGLDPRARSYLIHRLAPLKVDPRLLVRRLRNERHVSTLRALLLSLGEFNPDQVTPSPVDEAELLSTVLRLYREHPDAGVHGASEWLLRQWHQQEKVERFEKEWMTDREEGEKRIKRIRAKREDKIARIQEELTKERALGQGCWYVNGQGQTMVVIAGPTDFLMGSPHSEHGREGEAEGKFEAQHREQISRSYAIAAKEVTVEQFQRFRQNHAYYKQYSREASAPINNLLWYEAAAYCNWLSAEEGIDKSNWCYLPNAAGEYAEGMKIRANYKQLTGYRLPSEVEWEYACRAGAVTSRYYGESETLLGQYAWYTMNSLDRWMLPVGSLKPNDLGLFDMLGNAQEWCQNIFEDYSVNEKDAAIREVTLKDLRVLRGGSFVDQAMILRSASRVRHSPSLRIYDVGFRPVRAFP